MADIISLHDDPHRKFEMLLPWYANGELDSVDAATVEAHLHECAECRTALEVETRLMHAVKRLPLRSDLGWEKLQQRLAPDIVYAPARSSRKRWRRGGVAAFFIAQAAVVVLALLVPRPAGTPPDDAAYHTLGSPERGDAIVIFQPDTTEKALREALANADARLIDGPTASGAYVLQIPPRRRAAALAGLRGRQDVLLAQPIGGEGR